MEAVADLPLTLSNDSYHCSGFAPKQQNAHVMPQVSMPHMSAETSWKSRCVHAASLSLVHYGKKAPVMCAGGES
eukprot:1154097-Pelagomonas_calceolata.AAC.3